MSAVSYSSLISKPTANLRNQHSKYIFYRYYLYRHSQSKPGQPGQLRCHMVAADVHCALDGPSAQRALQGGRDWVSRSRLKWKYYYSHS